MNECYVSNRPNNLTRLTMQSKRLIKELTEMRRDCKKYVPENWDGYDIIDDTINHLSSPPLTKESKQELKGEKCVNCNGRGEVPALNHLWADCDICTGKGFIYYPPKLKEIDTTAEEKTEQNYIDAYDKIGCEYFGKGNDAQLKEWGNSDARIRQIKIESVKGYLDFYKKGIDVYKMLTTVHLEPKEQLTEESIKDHWIYHLNIDENWHKDLTDFAEQYAKSTNTEQ